MVQSINTKVDLVIDATSFTGLTDYGQIMIGDNGFEFYHARDRRKYIQIPWEEVDYVLASVMLKGKWIPRYAIQTKKMVHTHFLPKNLKKCFSAIREYVDEDRMVQSLSFFDVVKRGIRSMFKRK
ncbi:DUF956 family protein [Enterococcus faecium]|nr:DUF956 family protein [Enterococcus faecium]